MPQIPQYDGQHVELNPDSAPNVKLDKSAEEAQVAQGAAVQSLGNTVESTLTDLGQHMDMRQKQQDNLQGAIGLQSLSESISASDAAAKLNMAPDGTGWRTDRLDNANTLTQNYLQTLSPDVRQKFQLHAGLLMQKYGDQYAQEQLQANQTHLTGLVTQSQQGAANSLYASGGDVASWETARDNLNFKIDNLPIPADQKETLRQKLQSDLAQASITGAATQAAKNAAATKIGTVGPGGTYTTPPAAPPSQPYTQAGLPGTPSGPAPTVPTAVSTGGQPSPSPTPANDDQTPQTATDGTPMPPPRPADLPGNTSGPNVPLPMTPNEQSVYNAAQSVIRGGDNAGGRLDRAKALVSQMDAKFGSQAQPDQAGAPPSSAAPSPAAPVAPAPTPSPVIGKVSYDGSAATVNGTTFSKAADPVDIAEQFKGMGVQSHKDVVADFIRKSGGHDIDPAQIPWCAAFVDAALGASGRAMGNTMRASDFLNYGTPTNSPTKGDVVVMNNGSHVGLVIGVDGDGVHYIAGNDSHRVQENTVPMSAVTGFRHPPETPTGLTGPAQQTIQGTIPNRQPINVSASDRDLLIRTIYGEAAGESDAGKSAVAHVIANRVASGNYGSGVQGVIMAPKQFSLWNPGDKAGDMARNLDPNSGVYQRIGVIADAAMAGKSADPTNGAEHYYNPRAASPEWGDRLAAQNDVTIGNHRFVGKGSSAGTQQASVPIGAPGGARQATPTPTDPGGHFGLDPNDPRLAAVPWQQRRAIEMDAMRGAEAYQTQQNATVLAQHNAYMDQVKVAALDGKYGNAQMQSDRAAGKLSTYKDISEVQNIINKNQEDTQDLTNFNGALANPGFQFNPYDKDHQKMVDAGYDDLAKHSNPVDAAQRIIERTGMVPSQATTGLRGAMISGDATQAQNALVATSNILRVNPNILDAAADGAKLAKQATTFNHYTADMGMDPKVATQRIVESETPEYQRKVAMALKDQDINQVVKQNLAPADLESAFNAGTPYFGRPSLSAALPKTQQALMGDYEDWFKVHYQETGDVGQAKALAQADLKKVWGTTNVTGTQVFTRYPIEQAPAYAGLPNMADTAANAARDEIMHGAGQDVPREKIMLTPTPDAPDAWRSGKAPPMTLQWMDANGHMQIAPHPLVIDPGLLRFKQANQRHQNFDALHEQQLQIQQSSPVEQQTFDPRF